MTFARNPRTLVEFDQLLQTSESLSTFYKGTVRTPQDNEPCAFLFAQDGLLGGLRDSQNIAFDGTFFVVPSMFYQMFTVFFVREHHFFPGIVVLMTGKTYQKYLAVFEAIHELIPAFDPIEGMSDFEIASRNAANNVFEHLNAKGCFFHFTKCVFKHLQKLGLSNKFLRDPAFKSWAKCVMGLPLLPANLILSEFETLEAQQFQFAAADQRILAKFKTYVRRYWISQVNEDVLSVHGVENATNNGAESFHSWIKSEIKVHNPNCWNFIFHLNDILEDKALDFRRMTVHGTNEVVRNRRLNVQQNLDRRRQLEQQLAANEITPQQFLRSASHSFDGQVAQLQQALRQNPNILDDDPEVVDINDLEDDLIPDIVHAPAADAAPGNAGNAGNALPECVVCYNPRDREFVLIPCGHTHTCSECIETLTQEATRRQPKKCPYCRTIFTGSQQLYRYVD
jgi:hypothetical protein